MIDFRYLEQGLFGLANASQAGTMAGHLGAAVAAGYYFGEDRGSISGTVAAGVEAELDRVIAGEEAIWFNARKAGVTSTELFRPLPLGDEHPDPTAAIVAALMEHKPGLRQSGHDVIFASIAVRGLHDHREFATVPIVAGIVRLIRAFATSNEGRGFYGVPTGWRNGQDVAVDPSAETAYGSTGDLAIRMLRELSATATLSRQGFGGLWHLINHAAAIVELGRYGFADQAGRLLADHHRHLLLWRSLPESGPGKDAPKPSESLPWFDGYWGEDLKRDQARLTHRIKTMYGYGVLCSQVADEALRREADDAFRYLMD